MQHLLSLVAKNLILIVPFPSSCSSSSSFSLSILMDVTPLFWPHLILVHYYYFLSSYLQNSPFLHFSIKLSNIQLTEKQLPTHQRNEEKKDLKNVVVGDVSSFVHRRSLRGERRRLRMYKSLTRGSPFAQRLPDRRVDPLEALAGGIDVPQAAGH